MVFSSITFLFCFLPLVIAIYFTVPYKAKNIILLISSFIFYFLGEPKFMFIFISSIFSNYIFGLIIDRYDKLIYRKIAIITAITLNIILIGLFKYSDFIIVNLNIILPIKISLYKFVLPIGISFYTFQAISYLIDVYRKEVKVQKDIIKLALYISLFPQLIAGPIVRYQTINEELSTRKHSFDDFSYGVRRFIFGLSKKLIIADQLASLWMFSVQTNQPSVIYYWLGAIAFSLQIYFDFSAYSDMAIGMGRMFGFHFLENFNYPFSSKSITEFWHRWHISLGSWFRDYIYIPLGGNRKGKLRWGINIFIVWCLTGLWHGADWNFILWGLLFGVILVIEKMFLLRVLNKIPPIFSHIYTMLIVVFSFVLFNNSILDAIVFIKSMLFMTNIPLVTVESNYYLSSYLYILIIAIIFSTEIPKNIFFKLNNKPQWNKIFDYSEPIILSILLLLSVGYMVDSSFQPFLYFRF